MASKGSKGNLAPNPKKPKEPDSVRFPLEIPEGILLTEKMEDLCHWLCVCVSEVRKEDGAEYTPRSISHFVAWLQRYINERH